MVIKIVKVRKDLTGQRFGKLTVLYQVEDYISPSGKHYDQWLCECSCEKHNQIIVTGGNLKQGNTRSCGCLLKKKNEYELNLIDKHGLYGIGYCFNTKSKFYFDMDDYDKIKDFCWTECTRHGMQCLVCTHFENKKTITMHILLGLKYYDHIDRNELNNRKYNLRPATPAEQCRNRTKHKNNTSGIIGVNWDKRSQKWRARVHINGKEINLGYFENKTDAIITRLEAEQKYYGEFSPQQHLFQQYKINK